MSVSPFSVALVMTLFWFVIYWMIGGVLFSVIGLVRFFHVHKTRFSCLFTFFAGVAAFGAAWMGLSAASLTSAKCLGRTDRVIEAIPNMMSCAQQEVLSAGVLWFLFLLVIGILLLFITRAPERSYPSRPPVVF